MSQICNTTLQFGDCSIRVFCYYQQVCVNYYNLLPMNDREKNIIRDRKLSEDPKTLDELSKEYKISRERIRQIEERAFQKLQMEMLNLAKERKLIQA